MTTRNNTNAKPDVSSGTAVLFLLAAPFLLLMLPFIGMTAMGDVPKAFANSVPFMNFFGIVAGGWQLFRGAKIAAEKLAAGDNDPFFTAKIQTATYYAHNVLSQAAWLQKQIVEGSGDVMTGTDDNFEVERRALVTA